MIIVVVLALFFTHRFIGPFERLKMEMRLILTGNYHRRLSMRNSDDFYIRSFVSEVNKMLGEFEKNPLIETGSVKALILNCCMLWLLLRKSIFQRINLEKPFFHSTEKWNPY